MAYLENSATFFLLFVIYEKQGNQLVLVVSPKNRPSAHLTRNEISHRLLEHPLRRERSASFRFEHMRQTHLIPLL